MNIDYKNINFLPLKNGNLKKNKFSVDKKKFMLKNKGSLIFSPYIITPLSLWCQYISRTTTNLMRKSYEKLAYWETPLM
jgi:hypothetical protein